MIKSFCVHVLIMLICLFSGQMKKKSNLAASTHRALLL